MKRFFGFLSLGLLFFIFSFQGTSAAQIPKFKLTLSPIFENEVLSAGSDNDGSLNIYNQGQDPIFYSIYATPYGVKNESYTPPDFKPLPNKPNISSWFHFSNPGIIILPGKISTINYSINVPKGTPGGGYYAAIFVQSQNGPVKQKVSSIEISERLGELFYLEVPGNIIKSSKLASWSAAKLQGDKVTATLRLEDAGSIHYFAGINVNFHSIFGGSNYSTTLNKVVLPETIREISVALPSPPAFALYRVSGNAKAFNTINLGNRYILIVSVSTRIKALIAVGLVILIILLDVSFSSIIQTIRSVREKMRK